MNKEAQKNFEAIKLRLSKLDPSKSDDEITEATWRLIDFYRLILEINYDNKIKNKKTV